MQLPSGDDCHSAARRKSIYYHVPKNKVKFFSDPRKKLSQFLLLLNLGCKKIINMISLSENCVSMSQATHTHTLVGLLNKRLNHIMSKKRN